MMLSQDLLFDLEPEAINKKTYSHVLTVTRNGKGVIDVDTVKGCTLGMGAYPDGGCYNECYANKTAYRYGLDFTKSISRKIIDREHLATITKLMNTFDTTWYRIGTSGDPSHDWNNTIVVCNALRHTIKIPVIVTKHWIPLADEQIDKFARLGAVFNTSTSGMDTDGEIKHRVEQIDRLKQAGIKSINRIVTCKFGKTEWARRCKEKQDYLLSIKPIIDNPFRCSNTNVLAINGDIIVSNKQESTGGGCKLVSLQSDNAYLGLCEECPDQCGIDHKTIINKEMERRVHIMNAPRQLELMSDKTEFLYFKSVIGSGYEEDVKILAIEDGIAHRAARKNMQIHSAIILKINDDFAGFMTFQNNDECKEFCLLQSVIKPCYYNDDLYKDMVLKVIEQNTDNYPIIMTTNPKSKFETPKLFESLGFETYLKMGEFCYMIKGNLADARMKLLAHITMTNVWNTTKGGWLKVKKEWKARINEAGEKEGVANPMFASREGCWQGEKGFANVVTGHSHNGNASVLDPVACEVILKFFMPKDGKRVYNPFGGGVQFGYVTGYYGYEYIASEIRQNQCDVNNLICKEFDKTSWVKSDSSTYKPDGMFDLVFTCPPYYRVERYVDYDNITPEGEINMLNTYDKFRDALFSGYKIAIDKLNDNSFFIVMTGDSRDSKGAYHGSEAETEMFLINNGLSIYNKIIYLECEFTRLAQAKKTLNTRKFPKREQKIIIAYKGDISKIGNRFAKVGRL